jgi:hypothetical protein
MRVSFSISAGSIAGEVVKTNADTKAVLSQYNGMAYRAKLAVFDFHNAGNYFSLSVNAHLRVFILHLNVHIGR